MSIDEIIDVEFVACGPAPSRPSLPMGYIHISRAKTRADTVEAVLRAAGYNVEAVRHTKLGEMYFQSACAGITDTRELLAVVANLARVNPMYRSPE